ncbi:AzlC family ABC transporter permease [Streptomyces sp. NPDC088745]|uniref:AzlC family ABC transporter permease n=1 Tax=Streptomyces sp. NPDC088745 TaxID=3365884 RepID=UPI0038035CB4
MSDSSRTDASPTPPAAPTPRKPDPPPGDPSNPAPSDPGSGAPAPRTRFRAGLRIGAGFGAASFLLALSFGAVTQAQGWGVVVPIVCSAVVFSGSAQFALVATLSTGGLGSAVAAAAMINSRFLPMGVAVAGDLRGGRLRRAFEGQAVVDASWAAAHLGGGRFDRSLLFGATLAQWPPWVAGTALGVVLAPDAGLQHTLGLDVLTPALFAALLLDELRKDRANRLPALAGALLAAVLIAFLPTGLALIGSGLAALTGLWRRKGARA